MFRKIQENCQGVNINLARPHQSMPELPNKGALVKVCYAGACMGESYVNRRRCRPSLPGQEFAGVLQSVSKDPLKSNCQVGDKVIIYPDDNCKISSSEIADFLAVQNIEHLVQVPNNISMEVASMLPGAALTAYSAVKKVKAYIESKLKEQPSVNVLIVGAGIHGLWTLQIAAYILKKFDTNRVHVTIADGHIDRLLAAQEYGCCEIIYWNEEDHEQYIIERTRDACRGGGVDVAVDYVGSQRTVSRVLSVLNKGGVLLFGGQELSEVTVNLQTISDNHQHLQSIPKGTQTQLQELVTAVATNNIKPPCYSVYNVEQAAQVFSDLSHSRIIGRAILKYDQSPVLNITNSNNNNLNHGYVNPREDTATHLITDSAYLTNEIYHLNDVNALCNNADCMDICED